jgi:hypothetical protein
MQLHADDLARGGLNPTAHQTVLTWASPTTYVHYGHRRDVALWRLLPADPARNAREGAAAAYEPAELRPERLAGSSSGPPDRLRAGRPA